MYRMDSDALDAARARAASLSMNSNSAPRMRVVKRAIDIAAALTFFHVFGWLYLGLWSAVAIFQGRPAIYRHRRVGLNGRKFDCLKFRSMVRDSEPVLTQFLDAARRPKPKWERDFKLKDDPRVTPFGRFLRATSLDELPQFWNVLRGDMSLVGPRPREEGTREVLPGSSSRIYAGQARGYRPWQVGGRNEMPYEERVALDCEYVRGDGRTTTI